MLELVWPSADGVGTTGGYTASRDRLDPHTLAGNSISAYEKWIFEGIYGRLAEEVMLFATTLIWIDIEETECSENIKADFFRRGGTATALEALLEWTMSYSTRTGSSSHFGHLALVEGIAAPKLCARFRNDIMVSATLNSQCSVTP